MYRVAREAVCSGLEADHGKAYASGLATTVGLAVQAERAEKKPTAAAKSRLLGRLEGRREILIKIIQDSIVGPGDEEGARKVLQGHERQYREALVEDEAWMERRA